MSGADLPDRELDALVARFVFGTDSDDALPGWWPWITDEYGCQEPGLPAFSAADAWLVVEAMRERGWSVFIDDTPDGASAQVVNFNCEHHTDEHVTGSDASGKFRGGYCALSDVGAPSAPRAICLAALAAVGVTP